MKDRHTDYDGYDALCISMPLKCVHQKLFAINILMKFRKDDICR